MSWVPLVSQLGGGGGAAGDGGGDENSAEDILQDVHLDEVVQEEKAASAAASAPPPPPSSRPTYHHDQAGRRSYTTSGTGVGEPAADGKSVKESPFPQATSRRVSLVGLEARTEFLFRCRAEEGSNAMNLFRSMKWETDESQDIFAIICRLGGFQSSSAACQRDNALSVMRSRLSRSAEQDPDEVLLSYHKDLLANYIDWCKFLAVPTETLATAFGECPAGVAAAEQALYLLIWGEAANMRFTPEFLCWVYHKMVVRIVAVLAEGRTCCCKSFLQEVITPVYFILEGETEKANYLPVDYSAVMQHDDLNELFWRREMLEQDLEVLRDQAAMGKLLCKTFLEKQGWTHTIFAFWRVHLLHLVALHVLVVLAMCDIYTGPGVCKASKLLAPSITLYAGFLLKDLWDLSYAVRIRMSFGSGGCSRADLVVLLLRSAWRLALTFALVILFSWNDAAFVSAASLSILLAAGGELLVFIRLAPPSLSQLRYRTLGICSPTAWLALALTLLTDSPGLRMFTTGLANNPPAVGRRIMYSLFWVCVLGTKMAFDYFAVVKPLVDSTNTISKTNVGSEIDFDFATVADPKNVLVLVALWLGSIGIVFIDTFVFFIVWSNVVATLVGLWRRVGEVHTPSQVGRKFTSAHVRFFKYLSNAFDRHARFALIWNEIVSSMRQEDIINDDQMSQMLYFTVHPKDKAPWQLLPAFLVAGCARRVEAAIKEFKSDTAPLLKVLARLEDNMGAVSEISRQASGYTASVFEEQLSQKRMKLAKLQSEWLNEHIISNDGPISGLAEEGLGSEGSEALRQVFLSGFYIIQELLPDSDLGEAMWQLYVGLAGDSAMRSTLRNTTCPQLLFYLHKMPDTFVALRELAAALTLSDSFAVSQCHTLLLKLLKSMLGVIFDSGMGSQDGEIKMAGALARTRAALLSAMETPEDLVKERVQALQERGALFLRRAHVLMNESAEREPGAVQSKEAERRVEFFINSLYMEQPTPTPVGSMPSWSTLTPYYSESVLSTLDELRQQTGDGVTVLEYLRTIYPLEWAAFVERLQREQKAGKEILDLLRYFVHTSAAKDPTGSSRFQNAVQQAVKKRNSLGMAIDPEVILNELLTWASYRGQTLARTVRGITRYNEAIRLLHTVESIPAFASLELLDLEAPTRVAAVSVHAPLIDRTGDTWLNSAELAESKYRYVVSCQIYFKMSADKRAQVDQLAAKFPVYIACVDGRRGDGGKGVEKYFSVLLKWDEDAQAMKTVYEVELPGPILIGEGKPNNQNHAIIFTRGEALQAIDMNQDATLEDALKQRQLLGEFRFERGANRGRIVGFREHVFTHNVSSVAGFFSAQELGFVTATQRVLEEPLQVRWHYGHPDLFDKVTAIGTGGISKASKGVHLSEDIFAGFSWGLRGGRSSQSDYIQVAKGRDVGVSQITGFTAKISMGNGMQARTREVSRLAQQMDLFRLLSFFYSAVGGFQQQCYLVLIIFLFVYSRVFLGYSGNASLLSQDIGIGAAISTEFALQLGFMLVIPFIFTFAVENGPVVAVKKFLGLIAKLGPLFYIFSAGTSSHYVNAAITKGEAHYHATGRGFVIEHESFLDGFRSFLHSHYMPAFELFVLLLVYARRASSLNAQYWLETWSIYLLVVAWLYVPSAIMNPNGLDSACLQQDGSLWIRWMSTTSNVNDSMESWGSWYKSKVNRDRRNCSFFAKLLVSVYHCRLLVLFWAFIREIEMMRSDEGEPFVGVFYMMIIEMLIAVGALIVYVTIFSARAANSKKDGFSRGRRLMFFGGVLGVIVLLIVLLIEATTIGQVAYMLGAFAVAIHLMARILLLFVPPGYVQDSLITFILPVHFMVGLLIIIPPTFLSFLPFLGELQTRMLYNQEFTTRFAIAKITIKQEERQNITK